MVSVQLKLMKNEESHFLYDTKTSLIPTRHELCRLGGKWSEISDQSDS